MALPQSMPSAHNIRLAITETRRQARRARRLSSRLRASKVSCSRECSFEFTAVAESAENIVWLLTQAERVRSRKGTKTCRA